MQDQKSYAEFILGAYRALLVDCAQQYPELAKEFDRDYLRLSSAIKCHGIRFALDTMPSFRKHLDKCLSDGRLTHSHLLHFGTYERGGVIPRLFRGLTLRVFDRFGLLRIDADPLAIRLLRQLLGVVRKLRMDSSVADTGNSVRDFYRTDAEVRKGDLPWDDHHTFTEAVEQSNVSFQDASNVPTCDTGDLFSDRTSPPYHLYGLLSVCQRIADILSNQLGSFDPMEWKPRHGPGAVSDHGYGSYKYSFRTWSDRLEHAFPLADFAFANYACGDALSVKGFDITISEPPSRLCAVPKTIKTPRLIAAEPLASQWCQQVVRDFLYTRVSKSIISNFIDFRRQDLNGDLALEASLCGSHSTIDLSSASDRISCWHVERLFRRCPSLLIALQSSRTVWIEQDICKYSPRYHYLRKYCTMGNATTFPVQSLFFLTLALASVFYTRGLKPSHKELRRLGTKQVRVFGDDIIIPDDSSAVLVELLEALNLRVNTNKTFLSGMFRESCGVDAYRGINVTTVSVLDVPRRTSPSSIASTVDVHNNLIQSGYFALAGYLRKIADPLTRYKVKEVEHGDGAFGWSTYGEPNLSNLTIRWNRHLHRFEAKCLCLSSKTHRQPAEGYPGLLQFFTEAAKKVTSASSTLGYLAQRPQSRLALGWAPLK